MSSHLNAPPDPAVLRPEELHGAGTVHVGAHEHPEGQVQALDPRARRAIALFRNRQARLVRPAATPQGQELVQVPGVDVLGHGVVAAEEARELLQTIEIPGGQDGGARDGLARVPQGAEAVEQ